MSKIGYVYWFLRGSKQTPSSRIQGINVHQFLVKQGIASYLVCLPFSWLDDLPLSKKDIQDFVGRIKSNDIVIIQKFEGVNTVLFLKALRASKALVVYLDCDYPLKEREAMEASWVVCSSSHLADLYRQKDFKQVMIIEDAVERFMPPVKSYEYKDRRAVWYGRNSESKWNDINKLLSLLTLDRKLDQWQFLTISNSEKADLYWDERKSYSFMHSCNALLVPSFGNDEGTWSKSANRVTQGMALGLPVLASPIPSYREIIEDGSNGFLCETAYDWIERLKALEDEDVHWNIANQAYEYALKNYSIDVIGRKWIDFFNFTNSSQPVERPAERSQANTGYMLKIKMDWLLLKEAGISLKINYAIRMVYTSVHFLKALVRSY